jgi:hypothetical protein
MLHQGMSISRLVQAHGFPNHGLDFSIGQQCE